MLEIIKQTIRECEGVKSIYFININPVDDIPTEAIENDIITFNSSSSLMLEAFREANI